LKKQSTSKGLFVLAYSTLCIWYEFSFFVKIKVQHRLDIYHTSKLLGNVNL